MKRHRLSDATLESIREDVRRDREMDSRKAAYAPEDCQGCGTPTNNGEGGLCAACSA